MKERAAGGVVYRRVTTGELQVQLILDRFGKITLAKGKLEAGETVEQAAVREIAEETGVNGEIVAPIAVVRYDYEHPQHGVVNKEVHYFLVKVLAGETRVQVEEIAEVLWLAPLEAWNRQMRDGYENNHDILRYGLQMLGVEVGVGGA